MLRNRRIVVGIVVALALIAIARHPRATVQILTHDATETAPHRMLAAIDLGCVAVSVLVTGSDKHLS